MVKLKTKKQEQREKDYLVILETYQEVDLTCEGSQRRKIKETQKRIKAKGVKYGVGTIFNVIRKQS
jgi:hypothetical protein